MSILQYPDAINAPDLQVWNNAAFDNEESEGSAAFKTSWSNLHSVNLSESFESDCSKENLSPLVVKTPAPVKSSVPIRPLCPNSLVVNSQGKPFKVLVKEGLLETPVEPKKEHGKREEKENTGQRDISLITATISVASVMYQHMVKTRKKDRKGPICTILSPG